MKLLRNKYVDTTIVFLLTFIVAYFFNNEDPFFSKTEFNLYFYVLSIITLFYGFICGVFFLGVYVLGEYALYELNFMQLSHYFISLFIFSEFYYFWNNKINKLQIIKDNIQERLEELANAYFVLKTSHDEIEKAYILKPYSIRNIFKEIQEKSKNEKNRAYEEFFFILKQLFKVESAAFFIKKNKYHLAYAMPEKFELDMEDPLIKESLSNKLFSTVANNTDSIYIASIPVVDTKDEIKALFVIKQMPFFSLTKENMLLISMFLNYFFNLIETTEKYSKYGLNEEFVSHLDKLSFIKRKYGLRSYVIITDTDISDQLRHSDLVFKDKKFYIILPFTTKRGVDHFIKRTKLKDYKSVEIKNSLEKSINEIKK